MSLILMPSFFKSIQGSLFFWNYPCLAVSNTDLGLARSTFFFPPFSECTGSVHETDCKEVGLNGIF